MRVSREISLGSSLHRASTDALINRKMFPVQTTKLARSRSPTVPPTSTDLSVFLRILRTNYGQKVKNTDAKSASEGVASVTVSGGLERYTEISRKIRRLCSLPTVRIAVKLIWRYCANNNARLAESLYICKLYRQAWVERVW